ncbi:MAG: molybdenum ABC transporter ATP-binding protein [Gammaproteobacteria bacterium]
MNEGTAVRADVRLARETFALELQFAAPARGITGILGPSGSGKTTLLRCIAGLERDCRGTVAVNGAVWQDDARFAPPHQRAVGFVFQDARLFPHLSVRANLEYGMRRSAPGGVTFHEAVELLGLEALLARKPAGLSAGEAQRVAIGRALLRAPSVILMDEPLANLDPARRREVLPFLERLHGRLTLPILYVSHSVDEVVRLCDHLVLMQDGRIGGAGSLQDVLARPDLLGPLGEEAGTVLPGTVRSFDASYELTEIDTPAGRLLVPGRHGEPGHQLRLRILARDVSVALSRAADSSILNILPARVQALSGRDGGHVDVRLQAGEGILLSRMSRRSVDHLGLKPGLECHVQIKGVAVKGGMAPSGGETDVQGIR